MSRPNVVRRQEPSSSGHTSAAAKGVFSANGATLAYSTLILFTYYFSRGSARVLLAGFFCLFLLQ